MSDTYRPGQGVAYCNNLSKLRSRGNSLSYGLVIGVDGDDLLLVRVQSTFLAARFYDEVLSMDDPCRDNVRLDSCPPPFSDVCYGSQAYGLINATGKCYAIADVYHPIRVPAMECKLIDHGVEVSEKDMELVWNHPILVQAEKGGSICCSDGTMRLGRGSAVSGEVPEPEDDLEPVSPFGGGTAMGDKLQAKDERDRKAKSGGAAVREERSVEDIKRDVDGMTASAEAHRGKGHGGCDGPR